MFNHSNPAMHSKAKGKSREVPVTLKTCRSQNYSISETSVEPGDSIVSPRCHDGRVGADEKRECGTAAASHSKEAGIFP